MIKKYLSVSVSTLLISFLALIFSFLLLKLQLKYLGVEDRGLVILAQANIAVLISLVRFGANQSVLRIIPDHDLRIVSANFFLLTIIQAGIAGTVVWGISKKTTLLGEHMQNLSTIVLVVFAVSTLLFNAISNFSFLVHNSKRYIFQTILAGVLNIGSLCGAALFTKVDVNVVLLSLAFSQVCTVICILWFFPGLSIQSIRTGIIRQLVLDGAKSVGWSFVKDLSYKVDLLIFGTSLSKYDFGIYSILQNLCQSVWRVTDPLIAAFQKYLLQVGKSEYFRFTNKVLLMLTGFILVSMLVAWGTLIPVFELIAGMQLDDYLVPALLLLFAMLVFNAWKLIANLFIQLNHHLSMYVTLVLLVASFFVSKPLISGLTSSALVTTSIYTITSLLMLLLYAVVGRQKHSVQLNHNKS